MPNFESFSRRLLPLKSDPTVTIHKRGTMSLNRSAFAALGAPDAVELLFDRDARIVGLRKVDGVTRNAAHVRRASNSASGPWLVTAMAFVRYYEIDTEVSRRWPAVVQDAVLCLDLTGPSEVVTSNRSRPVDNDGGTPSAQDDANDCSAP